MMESDHKTAPCDVHVLVDGDTNDKSVTYCKVCDAWLCEKCKDNLAKRAEAWGIRSANRVEKAIKEVANKFKAG